MHGIPGWSTTVYSQYSNAHTEQKTIYPAMHSTSSQSYLCGTLHNVHGFKKALRTNIAELIFEMPLSSSI